MNLQMRPSIPKQVRPCLISFFMTILLLVSHATLAGSPALSPARLGSLYGGASYENCNCIPTLKTCRALLPDTCESAADCVGCSDTVQGEACTDPQDSPDDPCVEDPDHGCMGRIYTNICKEFEGGSYYKYCSNPSAAPGVPCGTSMPQCNH